MQKLHIPHGMENDTVGLAQAQMAMLFDRDEKTVRKHINNVFSDEELEKEGNTHFLRLAHSDKPVAFYNLDVIISVGYRVKSQCGVMFRQWGILLPLFMMICGSFTDICI